MKYRYIMRNAHSTIYSNNVIYTCPTMQYTSIHNKQHDMHAHYTYTDTSQYTIIPCTHMQIYINVYNRIRINACIHIRAHMATMHTCSHTNAYATQCYHVNLYTTLPYTTYTRTYICMHAKTNIYIYIIINTYVRIIHHIHYIYNIHICINTRIYNIHICNNTRTHINIYQ